MKKFDQFIKMIFLLIITFLANTVFSYDAVIKDNRGRVKGYMDSDGDKTYILDVRGRRGDYIESDGTIKDKYGRKKGKVEKDD